MKQKVGIKWFSNLEKKKKKKQMKKKMKDDVYLPNKLKYLFLYK